MLDVEKLSSQIVSAVVEVVATPIRVEISKLKEWRSDVRERFAKEDGKKEADSLRTQQLDERIKSLSGDTDGLREQIGKQNDLIAEQKQMIADLRSSLESVTKAQEQPASDTWIASVAEKAAEIAAKSLPDKDFISSEVKAAVDAIPAPKDGKSVSLDDVRPILGDLVRGEVKALHTENPETKEPIKPADFKPLIQEQLVESLKGLPDSDSVAKMVAEQLAALDIQKQVELAAQSIELIVDPSDETVAKAVRAELDSRPAGVSKEELADAVSDINKRIEAAASDVVKSLPKPDRVSDDSIELMVRKEFEAQAARFKPQNGKDAAELVIRPSIDPEKSYPAGTWARFRGGVIKAERDTDAVDSDLIAAGWVVHLNGIDKAETEQVDERRFNVVLKMTDGTTVKHESYAPTILYRGVWRDQHYEKGDCVTYAGSTWIAENDNQSRPGVASEDWTLSSKQARQGERGKRGEAGKKGADGKDGKDLTQMDNQGRKW